MEFWRVIVGQPPSAESPYAVAQRAESQGWYGGFTGDSQHMVPDTYVSLGLAAAATTTLSIGVGVTNFVTRDPAVTASAIASFQYFSGGRAVLGVGRGDAAVRYLGREAQGLGDFWHDPRLMRAYLADSGPDADAPAGRASADHVAQGGRSTARSGRRCGGQAQDHCARSTRS